VAAKLIWVTPDADQLIGYMARVSNPEAKPNDSVEKLINYLIAHKHWSPFEMACACVEINTTRDIARQILRHRSFHFQEFSQRYAEVNDNPIYREARLQDHTNRQNSLKLSDELSLDDEDSVNYMWKRFQNVTWDNAVNNYKNALELGLAKEVARALLPEGLTPTKMYMQGTIRDWIHYLAIRTGPETQLEHRDIAREIGVVLRYSVPLVFQAAQQAGLIGSFEDG